MHDELFKMAAIVDRYRAGPYVEARERFLRQASAEGYSRSMLERIAWVLLTTAKAVQSQGGSISSARLRSLLGRRIRLGSGRRPSEHTATLIRRFGEAWLRSIGALLPDDVRQPWFAQELSAFTEYMRVERGLSPVTIATREERMRWFFASLPSWVRSLGHVTIGQIDTYLEGAARRGWSRGSLHALGSSLRSFFRYAAQQGWCSSSVALGIDLPRLYALGDVPKAPTIDEVNKLLEVSSNGNDLVTIRDHAILSLLIHYGLRRGEVERLTLDNIDWITETLHVTRPKLRRSPRRADLRGAAHHRGSRRYWQTAAVLRTARILPRPNHHSLRAPRRDDRSRPCRQISRRVPPRRSLIDPPRPISLAPPRGYSRHRDRAYRVARQPLPTSASQTLYRTREAEAGSPSNSATTAPSDNVIMLTWLHGRDNCRPSAAIRLRPCRVRQHARAGRPARAGAGPHGWTRPDRHSGRPFRREH